MFEDLRWVNDPDALTYIPKPIKVSKAVDFKNQQKKYGLR